MFSQKFSGNARADLTATANVALAVIAIGVVTTPEANARSVATAVDDNVLMAVAPEMKKTRGANAPDEVTAEVTNASKVNAPVPSITATTATLMTFAIPASATNVSVIDSVARTANASMDLVFKFKFTELTNKGETT